MRTQALRIGFALAAALALATPAHAASREQLVVELRGTPVVRAAPADAMRGADGRLSDRSFAARLTLAEIAAEQPAAERRIRRAVPGARVIGRMRHAMDALVVEAPAGSARALARLAGVREVWPSLGYHRTSDRTPAAIRAVPLWQLPSPVRGDGMRIGIVDDGIDIRRPSFSGAGYAYPAGFPKGLPEGVNGKVIVARAFAPPGAPARERTAFDPDGSAHGTHVAGIAAGNFGITATLESGIPVPGLSGVAPRAYLGSYRALTTPTPAFGLDGQGAALARAIDAAVADGMDVINLSVGEPPVGRRDVVERAIAGAARAGVVVTVAAGNDGDAGGHGTISSPAPPQTRSRSPPSRATASSRARRACSAPPRCPPRCSSSRPCARPAPPCRTAGRAACRSSPAPVAAAARWPARCCSCASRQVATPTPRRSRPAPAARLAPCSSRPRRACPKRCRSTRSPACS